MSSRPRDPETGQFVSADEAGAVTSYRETQDIHGSVQFEIPAADLGGGTGQVNVEGDSALEMLDFEDVIDDSEVFEAAYFAWTVVLHGHTTATAESWIGFAYAFMHSDLQRPPGIVTPEFIQGSPDGEVGTVDIVSDQTEDDDMIAWGGLFGESSLGDSTNGLGAGADYDRDRRSLPFKALYGTGPVFDANDFVAVPCEFYHDNVSDHAIEASVYGRMRGIIHQVD